MIQILQGNITRNLFVTKWEKKNNLKQQQQQQKHGYYSSQLIPHCVPRHVLLSVYKSLIISYLTYGICSWGYCAEKFQRKILIPGPWVSFPIARLRNTPYPSSLNRIAFPYLTYYNSEILAIYCMDQLLYRKPSIYKSPYRYL